MYLTREANYASIGLLFLTAAATGWSQTPATPPTSAGLRCPELQDIVKSTLVNRVRTRYQTEAAATVQLTDDSLVAGSCYHRLIFEIASGQRTYALPLYLSADQRFLTRDLTDIRAVAPNSGATNAASAQANAACAIPGAVPGAPASAPSGPVPVSPALLTAGASTATGSTSAPATLVVFSDFQCPYCKRAAEWVRAEAAKFDPQQLQVVYRYFPLSFHPWAKPAAEAAACVAAQSASGFWSFHDAVFANQTSINPGNAQEKLSEFALAVPGVKAADYKKCVETGQMSEIVQKDLRLGNAVQVHGTPTVFINGNPLPGLRSPEQLHAAIEEALRSGKKTVQAAMAR